MTLTTLLTVFAISCGAALSAILTLNLIDTMRQRAREKYRAELNLRSRLARR